MEHQSGCFVAFHQEDFSETEKKAFESSKQLVQKTEVRRNRGRIGRNQVVLLCQLFV